MPMSEYEALTLYREMLDEVYGTVKIGEYEYVTSRTMEEIDPIAFRTGFNDWADSEGIEVE